MILPEVPKSQWRTPSLAQPKDMLGNENQTKFRVDARANDGGIVWRGWFDDRDDADAFFYAAIVGSLKYEKQLWNLCSPNWQPYLDEIISYDFATVTFLSTPTGSNQTYTFPIDWSYNNTVEVLGAGGSGGAYYGSSGVTGSCCGGGGGAYSKLTGAPKSGSTTTYQIGTAGPQNQRNAGGAQGGTAGGDTWFGAATYAASSVGAKGGGAGTATSTTSLTGASGGAAASGIGTIKYSGGASGDTSSFTGNRGVSGGGGAAGLNGDGNASSGTGGSGVTSGGSGDAGFGGAGGSASPRIGINGGVGGNGTEWSASYGSGGGGGGVDNVGSATNLVGGAGGLYGAGGGASGRDGTGPSACTGGAGSSGLIVITYTPGGGLFGSGRTALGLG